MIKNDKIKLTKPMGTFTNVGEICEVINVTQEGVISFRFGRNREHLGCMSYDEFEKYFELVNEYDEHKRKWTEWNEYNFYYHDLEGGYVTIFGEYRENGRKVQVRCFLENNENNKLIKASSTCCRRDTFSLDTGLDLAKKRLIVKLLEEELKQYVEII